MKKFVQRFVPEYERILGMDYFTEHDINRRFLFLNATLLSILGFAIFILVGWAFNLLDNRSYVFYGYNMIFIVVVFLLIYSTEVQRLQSIKKDYPISVMIIGRFFTVLDGMVVMWGLLFFIYDIQLFSGLEGTIYNVVIILYLMVSILLRRQFKTILSGLPLALLMGAMLLYFSGFPIIIQYGLSLLIVSLLLFVKTMLGTTFFSYWTIRWLSFTSIGIILLSTFGRDNEIIAEGFDPLGNTVLELSDDQSFTEKYVHLQYFGYSFATTQEEDYSTIDIFDETFELVRSYQIDTTERLYLQVNFQDDTVMVTYPDSEEDYQFKVLEIDSSLALSDLGIMHSVVVSKFGLTYPITNQAVVGDVVFQNLDYIITDPGSEQSLNIYKRSNVKYSYQGQITREIFLGDYTESHIQILHMIDDVFVFGRIQNNAPVLYIANTSGHIVGGTYTGHRNYRGSETYFSNPTRYSSYGVIKGIYYEDDGTPVIYSDNLSDVNRKLFEVNTLYHENLNVGWTLHNKTEIASILFLFGLLIPISTKEEN